MFVQGMSKFWQFVWWGVFILFGNVKQVLFEGIESPVVPSGIRLGSAEPRVVRYRSIS